SGPSGCSRQACRPERWGLYGPTHEAILARVTRLTGRGPEGTIGRSICERRAARLVHFLNVLTPRRRAAPVSRSPLARLLVQGTPTGRPVSDGAKLRFAKSEV